MATELQVAFPQFNLETIMSVVESEITMESAAMKLMEMDEEINKFHAEQYALKQQAQQQRKKQKKQHTPPQLPTYQEAQAVSAAYKPEKVAEPPIQPVVSDAPQPVPVTIQVSPSTTEPEKEREKADMHEVENKMESMAIPTSTSYSDLCSPAVDLLLRGFGGREKHAPEKSTEHSLPSYVVEDSLKSNIRTNDEAPTGITPAQDLAARKEARRKARKERRERQQLQREAMAKLAEQQKAKAEDKSKRTRQRNANLDVHHYTSHLNKEKFALSQSSPMLNYSSSSQVNASNGSLADNTVMIQSQDDKIWTSRHGASSGYDTGNEYPKEPAQDVRPKQYDNNKPSTMADSYYDEDEYDQYDGADDETGTSSERKGAKFTVGPKYESSINRSGQRTKPSKYDKKSKKYSSRRKTLTYDHYSTDHQDRSSM